MRADYAHPRSVGIAGRLISIAARIRDAACAHSGDRADRSGADLAGFLGTRDRAPTKPRGLGGPACCPDSGVDTYKMTAQAVLISGAGIAGPALAFWLKAAGLQPTLVERAPALRTGGYVIDFWGRGYDIAERMRLTDDINRVGYHVRELRIVDRQGARRAGFGTSVFRELTGGVL
jgi:NADPH-dependent 2,4-dienoyl-CoA reductase/sulfur reductase-like enzyme